MEFAYDGGGLAKGGTVTLYVDGEQGRRGPRRGNRADDLLRRRDGRRRSDTASPVSDDYDGATTSSPATVNWVQIDLGEDAEDADHLITPEERFARWRAVTRVSHPSDRACRRTESSTKPEVT